MKISDQTTLRELEDGLEKEGFTKLQCRINMAGLKVGNVKIARYKAILFKGEEWIDAQGGSVAESIAACIDKWTKLEKESGE